MKPATLLGRRLSHGPENVPLSKVTNGMIDSESLVICKWKLSLPGAYAISRTSVRRSRLTDDRRSAYLECPKMSGDFNFRLTSFLSICPSR